MKEYTPIVMQRQRQATDQLTEEMQKDLEAFTKSITPPSPVPAPK
jgi:fructoselysine-6-P-deglycase FrlB-like protein